LRSIETGSATQRALWQRVKPHLALTLVQLMFGTWPIFGKVALRSLPSTGLVAFRVVGAAIALALLQGGRTHLARIERRDLWRLALCSLFGVVLNQFLFVKGLELSTAINATLLGTAIPVFALLASVALGVERLTASKVFGIVLAAVGVLYLVDPLRGDFSNQATLGNLLLVANTFFYGSYIALAQDLIRRYGALTVTALIFILGSLVTLPIGLYQLSEFPFADLGWAVRLVVLYIVLVPTVGAYYLNAWALGRVAPSSVAIYIYLQPLISFAVAPLVLGESISHRAWVAAALIFAGVAVVTRGARNRVVQEISECPDAFGR